MVVTDAEVAERLRVGIAGRWVGDDPVSAAARYAMLPPGRLMRPLLLVRSALAVGGVLDEVIPAAVGLECAHVGGLIHDDLIDQGESRRGRPAVHGVFGAETAIVTGSALFFTWFEALADSGVAAETLVEVMRVQADAGRLACRGAAMEVAMAEGVDTPVSTYLEMAHYKTAAMTSAACRTGALLGGAAPERVAALSGFGEALGMALQIRDDLAPHRQHSDMAGRRAVRRPTLPDLLAQHRAQVLVDAVHQATDLADHYLDRAHAHLAQLPDTPHRRALESWTHPGPVPAPRSNQDD
ncbi:polyprenyl synthetase family protein [Actinokineospora terrae]|uniref:Geranylgeranyl pyrophosphate synthase n=1 Tax=Actinokineospora terrae TaxID=155974 RepID=A0A1H9WCS4_9PSEU|nr:polyprenyl synthetase family protein [Actinokineospora terrae]SES31732.1 Geranylgeranyl pyrophosphate synthase [Actinokineospora terrae]